VPNFIKFGQHLIFGTIKSG